MKKIKSYAKINLFLKVLKKDKDFHKINSLIIPINLFDEIYIKERAGTDFVKFSGFFKDKINKINTVTKVLIFLKKKYPEVAKKNFEITVNKKIPTGSGLGGASSNAASIFEFLLKKYKIKISLKNKVKFLSRIGKDCPFFLNLKPKIVSSYGEKFKIVKSKINLNLLLIYPNVVLSTKKVFKGNKKISKKINIKNIMTKKSLNFQRLKENGNDLIDSAKRISPKIGRLLKTLWSIKGIKYASMSGSGSTCFAIFDNKKSLLNAKKIIKKQKKSYWTVITNTVTCNQIGA